MPARQHLVLHRVALVGKDEELARYVGNALRERWPMVVITECEFLPLGVSVDLVIQGTEPNGVPVHNTLWLVELTRTPHVSRLSATLWRAAMPLTARELLRSVALVFA